MLWKHGTRGFESNWRDHFNRKTSLCIGDEYCSHCVPFIEYTTDAGMLTPQPLFIAVEATEEEIAAVAEMLRKAMS